MYEDVVKRGAEWLDKVAPGWDGRIDINNLDLAEYNHCSLGQTFGGVVSQNLCADIGFSVCHGFTLTRKRVKGFFRDRFIEVAKSEWHQLSGAWTQEILRRRASARMQFEAIEKTKESRNA